MTCTAAPTEPEPRLMDALYEVWPWIVRTRGLGSLGFDFERSEQRASTDLARMMVRVAELARLETESGRPVNRRGTRMIPSAAKRQVARMIDRILSFVRRDGRALVGGDLTRTLLAHLNEHVVAVSKPGSSVMRDRHVQLVRVRLENGQVKWGWKDVEGAGIPAEAGTTSRGTGDGEVE